jgi:biotin carboxyl carrier protein
MRYFAAIGGRERTIDIDAQGGTLFRVSIDGGESRVIDAEHLEGHVVHMLVDGHSYEVDLEEDGDALNILVDDSLFKLEVLDERKHRLRNARGKFHVAGPQTIRAPMPGKVVKILATQGTEVAEGQGVVIIEAMKMENELRSPKAGRVAEVFVAEGQTVENRAALVSIE